MERTSECARSDGSDCGCDRGATTRRGFVQTVGIGLGAALVGRGSTGPVMAGPFDDVNEYLRVIPRDKRLDPAWVASLYARGTKEVTRDPEALRHIGMPVGGLFAGTVYLGGDGRLWLWDVFNEDREGIAPRQVTYQGRSIGPRDGANYVAPAAPVSPFAQGFVLEHEGGSRWLHASGWTDIAFDGRYPIGRVTYSDPESVLSVELEAFAPFCPMELDDSSIPCVILNYTVRNRGSRPETCALRGWMENAIARGAETGRRINRVEREPGLTMLVASAAPAAVDPSRQNRPDVVFADFEAETHAELGWTADGTAFGAGPVTRANVPGYQGNLGGRGDRVVNSHAAAPGPDVSAKDAAVGTLTSPEFTIERDFIHFLIGGGRHQGKTCLELHVDGRVVASATGRNANAMAPASFSTRQWSGKRARLRLVDNARGGWGNIGLDHVVFTDTPGGPSLERRSDFGTMALALLGGPDDVAASALGDAEGRFPPGEAKAEAEASFDTAVRLTGGVRGTLTVPGEGSARVTFVIAWHFPNFRGRGVGDAEVGHWHATRFADARSVARYVAEHFDRLANQTRRWVETWYDATLPFWLLDRAMASTSTLATTTCYRFRDGRFWAWEGVGCCEGTCTHVWHYAQSPARLFPQFERDQRARVDFGLALHPDGGIGMRAGLTSANEPAHDGQCGRILGAYREHQMAPDASFLRGIWPGVKKALEYMMARDGDGDGIVEGAQPNTLDAAWHGQVSFLASLYLAALRAGEKMATEMGDAPFAKRCKTIADRGARSILDLFNGEYFIQRDDPRHPDAIGVGDGCYIDQVFGQTWAHWVGLGTLFDRDRQLRALRALWNYNFVPDVGPFRLAFPKGRWYAVAGEAGLLMATWPRSEPNPRFANHWQAMYFNECMSGFEWQVAAHMIWEGHDQPDLLRNGLAIARAIHDRHDASRRNPYNEVECSDHYSRAMAAFGAFLAVCGFESHGPSGHLGFAPRLSPDAFRAPFTAAEGWGTFAQTRGEGTMSAKITARHGSIHLKTLALTPRAPMPRGRVSATLDGKPTPTTVRTEGARVLVVLDSAVHLTSGQELTVEIGEA